MAQTQDTVGIGPVGQWVSAIGRSAMAAQPRVAPADAAGGKPVMCRFTRFTPRPYSSAANAPAITAVPMLSPDTLAVDSDNRLAWRQGWLNYYQVPLAQVIEDLGRYYPGRILLLDGDLGQRKVSGSFPANDPLAALDALGTVVGFERKTLLGRVTLLR